MAAGEVTGKADVAGDRRSGAVASCLDELIAKDLSVHPQSRHSSTDFRITEDVDARAGWAFVRAIDAVEPRTVI
jgi:hypothetical protein